MLKASGAETVAEVLRDEGVKHVFGVHGGHIWTMMQAICDVGINIIHMRHEQSAAYAADGWARATGTPGVCFGTAGPGFYNMVPGLAHAHYVGSPIVALLGRHRTFEQGWGPFQEGHAAEVCKSFTKRATTVEDLSNVSFILRNAFVESMAYPPGPVVVELPTNLLGVIGSSADRRDQLGHLSQAQRAHLTSPYGDPGAVEQAVRMIINAERPVLIGGNGIFWSNASTELKEFAELLQVPVHTRRMGRGAVPEHNPLAFTGGSRKKILKEADLIVLFGHRLNVLEGYGLPPTFSHDADYIQVSESADDISTVLPTRVAILGSPRTVLKQMTDCTRSIVKRIPIKTEWLKYVRKAAEEQRTDNKRKAEEYRNHSPIHPEFLSQVVAHALNPNTTIIYDSFTLGAFLTDRIEAEFAGQVMDAGTCGGVGHGVGMGIGVQLGRPDKCALVIIGDAGIGVAGFDIETAARYNLPVVYLIFNNSGWLSPAAQKMMFPTMGSWGMLPEIKYDRIFAENSCHTELVTQPSQIKHALDRAFNSRKTSVINVIPDINVHPPLILARLKLYRPDAT